MKTASQSAEKFVRNAANASQDYVDGASSTTKDQAAAAVAAIPVMKSAILAAIDGGRVAKGLQKSGKQGWLNGVRTKGSERFASGVSAAREKYAANSAPYDGARGASANMPRGPRGSAANFERSKTVGLALNALRVGKTV